MTGTQSSIRIRWAAIGAAVAVTLGAAGLGGHRLVSADIATGDRPVFVPITPCRLADTRPAPNNVGPRLAPLAATEVLTITAHGANGRCNGTSTIPTDAVGLAMNVTALNATTTTYLTFWGSGANPGTANLNPAAGQPPTPNLVNTPLSNTGTFNVYNNAGTVNVVIDVNGYYANHNHDDRYHAKADVYTKTETDARYPANADVYTKAEADARYVAPPTKVGIGYLEFAPLLSTTNWTKGFGWNHTASGSEECLYAPIELPVGKSVTAVTANYAAAPSALDLRLTLGGIVNRASTGGLDDIAKPIIDAPASNALASPPPNVTSFVLNPAATADPVVKADYEYIITMCAKAEVTLLGASVELT